MPTRRTLLSLLPGTVLGAIWPFRPRPARASTVSLAYGWDPDAVFPTEASVYVAPDGDDDAAGTADRPLRTVQAGVDMLARQPGGSLAIRGGIYRETVNLDALRGQPGAGFRIHRYGGERVTISAAEVVTDWQPCPEEKAAELGLPAAASVWVARLDRSRLEHGAVTGLNLHEAGEWRSIATDRADLSRLEAPGDFRSFHEAEFLLDAEGNIQAIRDARLKGIPVAWIAQAQVQVYHAPNGVSTDPGAGFDPSTGTLQLADRTRPVQVTGKVPQMLYALRNYGPALRPGTWMVRDEGAEIAVYFLPTNPAQPPYRVEVSLRPVCIELGKATHVELAGIEAVRASGDDRLSGICIRRRGGGEPGEGVILTHCRAGENHTVSGRGYGAIYLREALGVTIHNCSVGPARNAFGLFLSDCQAVDLRLLHISGVSKSPARFYGLKQAVLAFSLFEDSAFDAHANKFNFYEGSDAVLVYGVRCRDVGGYATYQEASRIHFAFCELNCAPLSQNRALVSQNRGAGAGQGGADGSGDPVAGTTFYYWNNSLLPDRRHSGKANAFQLGPPDNSQFHAVHNNILHGGGFSSIYLKGADPARETRSHNRYTGFSHWQSLRYGWRLAEGEAAMPVGGRPGPDGLDMRPIIAREIAPLFPGFADWDRDIDGALVDWDRPPIGCSVVV